MSETIVSQTPEPRQVQVILNVVYEGDTREDLAQTMRHAMDASISVSNLLRGCDNIEAKVVDYTLAIHEAAESPALTQENPAESGNDYILNAGQRSVWIQVDDRVVYIRRHDDCLCVDVMHAGDEDGAPIDSLTVSTLIET